METDLKAISLSTSGPPLALVVLGALKLSQNFQGPHFKHEIGIIKPENGISLITKPTSGDDTAWYGTGPIQGTALG